MVRCLTVLSLIIIGSPALSQTSQPTSAPSAEPSASLAAGTPALPDSSWIADRVLAAQTRLSATEAGQLVWAAIERHGGLSHWYENGPLGFRFLYEPLGGRSPVDTYQIVDTWASRAWHRQWASESDTFGWNGEVAWVSSESNSEVNARFWSLTPYYFVAVTFVLADPGVNLSYEGEWAFEGRNYHQVRATFAEGTGDSPDDFYVVLIDTETHRVGGVRYIVAYPGFFPTGGNTPEKLLTYDAEQTVGGILFPISFRAFTWSDAGPGEHVTNASMSEVGFVPGTPASLFDPPDGATIQSGF